MRLKIKCGNNSNKCAVVKIIQTPLHPKHLVQWNQSLNYYVASPGESVPQGLDEYTCTSRHSDMFRQKSVGGGGVQDFPRHFSAIPMCTLVFLL